MEFWGVEVKPGEPLQVSPVPGMVIHLSQACLGETKSKGNEPVLLNVKVADQKLVLGILSLDKFPQLSFDLVFERQFELSHNWKNGSIHFCGYQTEIGDHGDDFDDFDASESEEEEDTIPETAIQNGKSGQKVEKAGTAVAKSNAAAVKPESSEKPKVKIAAPNKDDDDDDSDEDDDDDSSDDEEGSDDDSDEDMLDGDNDDDSDDESDEETPKKPVSKKRANESAAVKTPVPAKKAKADASPKSDGKKVGGHTATPHPAKKAGKVQATPATGDKSKAQTPKSGGVSCKSCSKTFGTEKALESHTKAKHA